MLGFSVHKGRNKRLILDIQTPVPSAVKYELFYIDWKALIMTTWCFWEVKISSFFVKSMNGEAFCVLSVIPLWLMADSQYS